jgi:hypothetical protein
MKEFKGSAVESIERATEALVVKKAEVETFTIWHQGRRYESFEKVARITCKNLEEAFHLSQHIVETPWFEADYVERIDETKLLRSTSVGDLIVDSNGRVFQVIPVGFQEIDK